MSQPPSSVKPMDSMRARDSTSRGSASGIKDQRSKLDFSVSKMCLVLFLEILGFFWLFEKKSKKIFYLDINITRIIDKFYRAAVKGQKGLEKVMRSTG